MFGLESEPRGTFPNGHALVSRPFGGIVHVDFWVFGFDVKFGAPPRAPPPVMLDRFWAVVIKSSGSSSSSLLAAAASDDSPQDTAAIILTCKSGLEPPPGTTTKDKDQSTSKWFVKANKFCFLATFQLAITSGSLVEERIEKKEGWDTTQTRGAVADIAPQYQEVYSKPMQLVDKLHSHVDILITAPRANALEDDSIHIMKEWKDQKWRITPVITPVPTSVWAKYDRNEDPAVVGNRVQGLLDGDRPTTPLVTGLSVKAPEPTEADDKVNGFDVIKDRMQDVYGYSETRPIFPESYAHTNGAWLPRGRSRDWVKFKQTWERVGDETSKNVADIWAKRLGFGEATVKKDDKEPRKFSPLAGAAPRQLLKRFDKIVPALPLIAVGSRVEIIATLRLINAYVIAPTESEACRTKNQGPQPTASNGIEAASEKVHLASHPTCQHDEISGSAGITDRFGLDTNYRETVRQLAAYDDGVIVL
ncbi:hypothetical protein CABS01_11788 [Colletotrichum abscissum]|uniref:Uncharacterized protein n=1 Tax=Colletotrichum abscissum TaxID=1671311 RepID=A0A9P9XBV2_9PEZI|nr:uncharacterized protein CABS01_11788 [Colletotrichum abscissum]KAI3545126.1 hypothetical protein CABS02_09469 [Colletotrichum abscissum]KAK1492891.1 hypothetical protein CABS01_11788 [Colletotrichum abscissum]